MLKRTAVVLARANFEINDRMTVVRSIVLLSTLLSVQMLDAVLHTLLVCLTYAFFVVSLPKFHVVFNGQATTLQEKRQLNSCLIFQVLVFGNSVVEVEHARGKTLLRKECEVIEIHHLFEIFRQRSNLIHE